MNPFKQAILDEVVRPALSAVARPLLATVLSYDKATNMATITFNTPGMGAEATSVLPNVPVVLANGLNHCGPFPGQRVLVTFPGGHYNNPVITGVVDYVHAAGNRAHNQTHRGKGAFLPDAICGR